jgi:hypothetical protein
MLASHIEQIQDTVHTITRDQRNKDARFLERRAENVRTKLNDRARHVLVDDERLARTEHVGGDSRGAHELRRDGQPLPILEKIGKVNQISIRINDADADVCFVKDLADLVADGVVDTLDISFAPGAA